MSRVDYSKWNNIEVSDDEDDTHPNIDTPSLFRWRHQARIEREEQFKEEKTAFQKEFQRHLEALENTKNALKAAKEASDNDKIKKLEKELEALNVKDKDIKKRQDELAKKERLTPLNVDSMCHEGKQRTIINKAPEKSNEPISEEDQVDRLQKFVEKNRSLIRKFGMFQKPDDSMNFLIEHPHLVAEETANHLVIWCIDLAVEEKTSLMNHVSHQTIVMQFMLELAKSLKIDPRACVRPFFAKFKSQEPEYVKAFTDELEAFRDRVRKRAEIRIEEAMAKIEAEEREKRLGPGGLDPVEVFETLPENLQKCFESKDIELLKAAVAALPAEEADYHMKRCVASGLWVPEGGRPDSGLVDAAREPDDDDAVEDDGDVEERIPETLD